MHLKDIRVVVTGGSGGLGLGVVEALVERGSRVTVVARGVEALASVRARLGVDTISADITDPSSAREILAGIRPDILVLNAGAKPRMGRLDEMTWADFNCTWETDVRGGFLWLQSALNVPLKPGSRVLVSSSGAAVNGSPLSGGYAGAKRMLWFMAKYANAVSKQKALDIRFQAIVPEQMFAATGVGEAGAAAYARAGGVEPGVFLARNYPAMSPKQFGDSVAEVLEDDGGLVGLALGIRGETGVSVLEGASA
ncbi:MAG TPA: SDR family NAD(P)-dependent oxidoreductase [Steroidobacteraceae bacterium]|jgi:NAD(P)-dependent dehydrogenase (short-subunit alcohol dehydrogenase family)